MKKALSCAVNDPWEIMYKNQPLTLTALVSSSILIRCVDLSILISSFQLNPFAKHKCNVG